MPYYMLVPLTLEIFRLSHFLHVGAVSGVHKNRPRINGTVPFIRGLFLCFDFRAVYEGEDDSAAQKYRSFFYDRNISERFDFVNFP